MQLRLTEDDLANLVLQRTGSFLKLGGAAALTHWFRTGEKQQLVQFLSRIGKTVEFVASVVSEISGEFEALSPFIAAAGARTVVSIGPGGGLFEYQLYRASPVRLILIDIEQSSNHNHGYAPNGAGYSSLSYCRRFLEANGVDAAKIDTINPSREKLPECEFDVLISLLSMGFHYPCDEYVSFVLEGLRKGGLMIIDKRKAVSDPGFDRLRPAFNVIASFESPKAERFILSKR